jgi:methylase of polypeptide subunit release factors
LYAFMLHRGAQTAVFELDIRISNPPYIDVCQSLASEAGLNPETSKKE